MQDINRKKKENTNDKYESTTQRADFTSTHMSIEEKLIIIHFMRIRKFHKTKQFIKKPYKIVIEGKWNLL